MPESKETSLAPFKRFGIGRVPNAGHTELIAYHNGRSELRHEAGAHCALAMVAAACFFRAPFPFSLAMIPLILVCGYKSAKAIIRLCFGPKPYHALPSGTTETMALLEDALRQEMLRWNLDEEAWERKVVAWRSEKQAWRRLCEEPTDADFEWTAKALTIRGQGIAALRSALEIEREELRLRRMKILRAQQQLKESLASEH